MAYWNLHKKVLASYDQCALRSYTPKLVVFNRGVYKQIIDVHWIAAAATAGNIYRITRI